MWRTTGWWERHPSQLYGSSDQEASLFMAVRSNEGHFHAECSAAGICDRSTGQCECFAGFEGSACNRTVCPNSCSGHGVCRTIAETLPADIEYYKLWEATKFQRCVCDGGYDGLDCSQRVCPRGDDPLTTTTTRTEYNKGLIETNERQYVDVRCRYGGTMVYPQVALKYTDPLTGDTYETSYFDISDTSSTNDDAVKALLQALPNQVLEDYVVDGTTLRQKIVSLNIMQLEDDNFYRISIEFHESMGDVPLMSARTHPDFICKNALDVATDAGDFAVYENIAPEAIGDGPRKYLEFYGRIWAHGGATNDVFEYQVFDRSGKVYNGLDAVNHTFGATAHTTSFALTGASTFDREAALVQFIFEAGNGQQSNDIRADAVTGQGYIYYRLRYDPMPEVKSSNPASILTLDTYGDVNPIKKATGLPGIGDPLYFEAATSATYDMTIEIIPGDDIYTSNGNNPRERAELRINGEHIAYINSTFSKQEAQTIYSKIPASPFNYRWPADGEDGIGMVWAKNDSEPTEPLATLRDDEKYVWYSTKQPISVISSSPDNITVSYKDQQAVNQTITLIIKISQTSGDPDRYMWKLAGDDEFVDDSGTGYVVPGTTDPTPLGGIAGYLTDHPDDARRAQAARILLSWNSGNDFDDRLCATGTDGPGIYYIQFGANGLNDLPVCANRGLCDASSGMCQCFAGYTGPDCAEQNALARGRGSA